MNGIRKNFVAKTVSKLLAAALMVTACLSGAAIPACGAGYGKNGVIRDMTSQQIVEDMGLGYNIGNTFDSIGSFITITDPWEYQKGWGNDPVTKQFIQKIRQGGFKTVRFPVSWAQWIDSNNQIDPGYMNAVQTVVDWCMEEDLYVILNIHHDSGAVDTSWVRKAATDWDWTSKRYEAVWTQISENFKNYGDHLIFEGMNEVEFPAAPSMSKQYELLNSMNQMFVDTVRKTGGNNASRHLLIPGYNTDIKRTCDRRYHFPNDPAGHCILSIHYYSPSPFCVAEHDVDWAVPVTTWGSEEDIQAVESDLNMLAEKFITKGTPVIIGEYGVLTEDNKEKESIRRYLSRVPEIIMEYGMCPILWDTSNAGDMKTLERVSGEFYDPVVGHNYRALAQKKAAGQIAKRQFNFPDYKRAAVPASPGGVVSLAAFDPADVEGISFTLQCKDGWDSYGGGGIIIEGLDKAIEYQFNSVFDEIVHIFTPEEKEKLKDQLTIAIWWTDESKGGNHREQISLENSQVTVLCKSDKAVPASRNLSSGKGGSGGGGGGGTSSRRPTNSANPGGGHGTVPENNIKYAYSVTEEQWNAHETTDYDLSVLCGNGQYSYEVGDTVRITLSSYCNKSYNLGISTNVDGEYTNKQTSRDTPEIVWEVTPDYGVITIAPYYMDKNAGGILYNLKAEVIKKAPRIDGFDVADLLSTGGDGEKDTYEYSLNDAYHLYDIEPGKRVKVTVLADEADVSGEVWFTDVNNARISWDLGKGDNGDCTTEAILVGTPKDGKLMFSQKKTSASPQRTRGAAPTIHVNNITIEQLPDADLAAEIMGRGRAELNRLIQDADAKEQEKSGLKIYYEYQGDITAGIGGQIVVDNQWDHAGKENWMTQKDDDGTYIWYEGAAGSSVLINCWSVDGGSWKITKLVRVKGTDEPEEEGPELNEGEEWIKPDSDGKYYNPYADQGKYPSKIRFTMKGENAWGTNITVNGGYWAYKTPGQDIAFDENVKQVEYVEFTSEGITMEYVIFIYTDEPEEEGPEEEGPELNEGEEWIKPDSDGKYYNPYAAEGKYPSKIRFTMKGENAWGTNITVNGGYWAYKTPGQDIVFDENVKQVEYVEFTSEGITMEYVIFIYTDEPEEEGPELNEGEEWIKPDSNGKYYNPYAAQGKYPSKIRFTMKGENAWGTNITVNGGYWAYKTPGQDIVFDENQVEYVEFTSEGITMEYVIFIYDSAFRSRTRMASKLASASYTLARINAVLSDEDVHKRTIAPDGEGLYLVPDDIREGFIGITGEVSSDEEVVLVFDEDEDTAVSVAPVNGKLYYFLEDGEDFGTVQFPETQVKKVTFLYKTDSEPELPEETLKGKDSSTDILKVMKEAKTENTKEQETDKKQEEENKEQADASAKDNLETGKNSEESEKTETVNKAPAEEDAKTKAETEAKEEIKTKEETKAKEETEVKEESKAKEENETEKGNEAGQESEEKEESGQNSADEKGGI